MQTSRKTSLKVKVRLRTFIMEHLKTEISTQLDNFRLNKVNISSKNFSISSRGKTHEQ